MDISFEGRQAQEELFETIIASAEGLLPYNKIHSGGAIRGAKSFTNSLAILTLAKMYPNSKWSVHRKDLTILESTTIETFSKIIQGQTNWKWNKARGNYHLLYVPNGSRIFFVGANESRDKDYTDTLGLEINGCFFDQLEDVSFEYYNAVLQRLGSWHIEKEPQPIALSTFNPHPDWIKTEIYEKFKTDSLPEDTAYFPLSPYNEPSNTDLQFKIWETMPPEVKARMIEGDWYSFDNKNPFLYSFDAEKHIYKEPLVAKEDRVLYLSFDFNIDPATCIVAQFDVGIYCHIIKSYNVANCTLKDLCLRIRSDYPNYVYKVTGDPSGRARNAGYNSPNQTMYSQIKKYLNISERQISKPVLNFSSGETAWRELRIFLNSVLQNHNHFYICPQNAKELIEDIKIATTEEGKDKLFKTSGASVFGMHNFDGFMYLLTTYFNDYVKR